MMSLPILTPMTHSDVIIGKLHQEPPETDDLNSDVYMKLFVSILGFNYY